MNTYALLKLIHVFAVISFQENIRPDKENKTSDQNIQPVFSKGIPPCIAALNPPIVMMITPGIVNNLSLVIIPLIVNEMMERLLVLSAILIQNRPVMIFPRKIMTAKTWISFSKAYVFIS